MTLIGSFSLAVGMSSFIILMLFVRYELSYDSFFKESDRIFLLGQSILDQESGGSSLHSSTSGIVAPTLKKEFEEVKYAVRVKEVESPLVYENKSMVAKGLYADQDFLTVFTFPMTDGDRETALMAPFSVVLSEKLAGRLFGNEDPIGKTVRSENQRALTVTGVIKDIPGNTHLKFDYLISFLTMYSLRNDIDRSWAILNYYSYIQLEDGIKAGDFENKLPAIIEKYHDKSSKNRKYFLVPLRKIHFATDLSNSSIPTTDRKLILILVSIAFLILVIACINYINIATARADARAREVAVRKINGASRLLLIRQFMTESYVLTFISIIFSLVIVVLLMPFYPKIFGYVISLDFMLDWKNIAGLAGLFLAVGLLAGGYPAFYLSSLRPLNILKSSFGSRSGKGQWNFRNILTVFQLGVSVILIVIAVTIQKQLTYIKTKDIGYNRENVLALRMWNEEDRRNQQEIKKELLNNPFISAAAVANTLPLLMTERNNISVETETGEKIELPMVTTYFIDEDYIDLFDMQITAGRNFSFDFSSNIASQVIINETAAHMAGLTDPVGKKINKWGREMEIIGVVKDFHFTSFTKSIQPLMFSYNPELSKVFLIRLSDHNIGNTLQYIDSTFRRFDSNFTFDYSFMDAKYNSLYNNESNLGRIILSFSILAMVIVVIGMYGLISFIIRRKKKEIAVRKVMGSSVSSVMGVILKDFFMPISVSMLVSLPVAYYIAHEWLNDFAYRINLTFWLIAFSILIILVIAFLSIVQQTIKAAVTNPIRNLSLE
ncbi:MAG: ABC transporter permease [Bacteroidales bacterium]|nr:ABC transporter permease [Bacteroidales bacterium]